MNKIISLLDFKTLTVLEKKRISYRLDDYLIKADNVKDLGYFIEIEICNTKDYLKAVNLLSDIIRKLYLDLNDIVKERYPK